MDNKFWEVHVDGMDVVVAYGAIGATARGSTKTCATTDKANAEMNKMITACETQIITWLPFVLIITWLPFVQMAQNLDLRCVLLSAPKVPGSKTCLKSITKMFNTHCVYRPKRRKGTRRPASR